MKKILFVLVMLCSFGASAIAQQSSIKCVMGYLYVFPDVFSGTGEEAKDILKELNSHNAYGYNDWRLPTVTELTVMFRYNKTSLDNMMDPNRGYLSSEYVGCYDDVHLYKIFDYTGRNWCVKHGCSVAGNLIFVRTNE